MKKSPELVKQVSREIIAAGVNLEMDWDFGDVDGGRGVIEYDYAYIGPGSYNGVEGFYFKRGDLECFNSDEEKIITEILNKNGFEVAHFSIVEDDDDRIWNASVGFVKKEELSNEGSKEFIYYCDK